MLFSTTLFLFLFLTIVLIGNLVIDRDLRNGWLLLVSLVFYAWGEPFMVSVMLATIIANWALGLWMQRRRASPLPLAAALAFNLGILVFFKYTDFLTGAASDLLLLLGWRAHPLPLLGQVWPPDSILHDVLFMPAGAMRLPIGISFFTFQAMSYVIDIRRGDVTAQRSPVAMGTYKSLFPQLIAGPIVRYRDVKDQIANRQVTAESFAYGVRRFIVGLSKKMLIADSVARVADAVFELPAASLTTPCAWLGVTCYTAQIYFDFSGYSDMAIGLGRMLGFRFLENFQYPYVARSITDFWRRWHISLSTWFRDYLYIPLGGNRRGRVRTYCNLVLVFALCGLWHGASFNFLAWGMFHGAFLVFERLGPGAWLARRHALIQHAYVMLTVMVGWVFFRSESLPKALSFLSAMAGWGGNGDSGRWNVLRWCDPMLISALSAALVAATPVLPTLTRWLSAPVRSSATVVSVEIGALAALAALLVVSCTLMAAGTYSPFIYFRF